MRRSWDGIMHKQDTIDSREVIKRIAQLNSNCRYHIDELDEDDAFELAELEAFEKEAIEQGCGEAEWLHGAHFINDNYFVRYIQEMLQDDGTLTRDLPWYVKVDWEETADNLKIDYSEINMGPSSFWVRSN